MSYNQNGNIAAKNNFGNSLDPALPASPITKKINRSFYLGKRVTSHDFSTLRLYMKKTIWVSGIIFDVVASAGQYMLGIPKKYKRVELAADIIHQHVLMSQKLDHRA